MKGLIKVVMVGLMITIFGFGCGKNPTSPEVVFPNLNVNVIWFDESGMKGLAYIFENTHPIITFTGEWGDLIKTIQYEDYEVIGTLPEGHSIPLFIESESSQSFFQWYPSDYDFVSMNIELTVKNNFQSKVYEFYFERG